MNGKAQAFFFCPVVRRLLLLLVKKVREKEQGQEYLTGVRAAGGSCLYSFEQNWYNNKIKTFMWVMRPGNHAGYERNG